MLKATARIRAQIRAIVRRPEIVQIVFWCGFVACRTRTIFPHSWNRRRTTGTTLVPKIHDASQWKGDPCERMDSKQDKNRSSLEQKVWFRNEQYSVLVQVSSLFQDNIVSSKTKTETYSNVLLQFLFLFLKEWTDIESQRLHDEFSKAITRLLRHDQSVPRGIDGAIHYNDIMEECRKKKFDGASQWLHEVWISKLVMGGEAKKIFQHCENPNSPNQFLYLRALQGRSGESAIDPALQEKYGFRKDLSSTSTTSGTRMNWIQWWETDEFQEEQASKEKDKRSSSLQWTR